MWTRKPTAIHKAKVRNSQRFSVTSHPAPSLSLPRPPAGQDGRARRAAGQRVPVHQRVRHEDHQRGHVVRGHSGWQPCCAHADNRRRNTTDTQHNCTRQKTQHNKRDNTTDDTTDRQHNKQHNRQNQSTSGCSGIKKDGSVLEISGWGQDVFRSGRSPPSTHKGCGFTPQRLPSTWRDLHKQGLTLSLMAWI